MAPTAIVVYLVRHAHAFWTPDEMRPLSPKGSRAAEELAVVLAAYPITHIVSSDATRAQQTVAPLAERLGLPIILEPDLRERRLTAAGESGEVFPDRDAFCNAVRATWQDPLVARPGGETNAAAQTRGVAVLRRLTCAHPGGRLVLSTHGNLLALILQHFVPSVGFDFWATLTMPDLVILKIDDKGNGEFHRSAWSRAATLGHATSMKERDTDAKKPMG